jgi:outer membrane protein TolC
VNQRFDFPSKYLLQKKINKNSIVLAEQEYELGRLLILLDAKMTLYDYLFTRRYYDVLAKRCDDFARLLDVWKKKLDAGAATILEYNRIALELSSAGLEKNKTAAEAGALERKLIYMSGGTGVIPEVIEYPGVIAAGPDELAEQKAAVHPSFLIPRTEYLISAGELNLSKTGALPGISLGVSSEIIPGERFTGPVAGLSIPLWANANRVKSASAGVKRAEAHMNAEVERLKTGVLKEYGKMQAYKSGMEELREIIRTNGGVENLNKALNAGEITVADYFSFLGAVYDAEERLIETEREYCKSAAVLTDHELLNLLGDQSK